MTSRSFYRHSPQLKSSRSICGQTTTTKDYLYQDTTDRFSIITKAMGEALRRRSRTRATTGETLELRRERTKSRGRSSGEHARRSYSSRRSQPSHAVQIHQDPPPPVAKAISWLELTPPASPIVENAAPCWPIEATMIVAEALIGSRDQENLPHRNHTGKRKSSLAGRRRMLALLQQASPPIPVSPSEICIERMSGIRCAPL